jgi:hypothetical protein
MLFALINAQPMIKHRASGWNSNQWQQQCNRAYQYTTTTTTTTSSSIATTTTTSNLH